MNSSDSCQFFIQFSRRLRDSSLLSVYEALHGWREDSLQLKWHLIKKRDRRITFIHFRCMATEIMEVGLYLMTCYLPTHQSLLTWTPGWLQWTDTP